MEELTRLIREDMRPALGVTEPGAIAFAVSKARTYVKGAVTGVELRLNSGMYKNAYTCGSLQIFTRKSTRRFAWKLHCRFYSGF